MLIIIGSIDRYQTFAGGLMYRVIEHQRTLLII
jgi:hypothetical protein